MGSSKNNSLVNNTNMLIPQSLQNLDIPPEYADKPVQEVRGIGLKYAERLKEKGIKTMKDLLDAGRTSKKQIELAKNTGISPELIETWMDEIFLMIRSRSITMSGRNWYDRKRPHTWTLNNSLIDIDGLELKYARRLAIFGIICWGDLLDKGRTPKKQEQLAKETGISKKAYRRMGRSHQLAA